MEASEMVDVLHYYFEEDYIVASTVEQARNVTQFRKRLYNTLYGRDYTYGYSENSNNASSFLEDDDYDNSDIAPFDVSSVTKPYIPPTEPMGGTSPFGALLDGPVG